MDIEKVWQLLNEYHKRFTKQRTDIFNFSLVLFGLLTSAIVLTLVEISSIESLFHQRCCCIFLIFLGLFMAIISILFTYVDNRTMKFADRTRDELVKCENQIAVTLPVKAEVEEQESKDKIKLPYTIEEEIKGKDCRAKQQRKNITFGLLIRLVYDLFFIIGIVACILGIAIIVSLK